MSHILVCVRVENLQNPYVPSEKEKCSVCDSDVWIDKKIRKLFPNSEIKCTFCIMGVAV